MMKHFNIKLLLDFLQTKINFLLSHDQITQEKLNALAGKTVAIALQKLDLTIFIDFEQSYFYLDTEKNREPVLILTGAPSAFLRLVQQNGSYTVSQSLQIEGDLHVAQMLQACIRNLNIDWVEMLAPYTGDIVAGGVEKTARGAQGWWRATRHTLWENTADYLQDEAQLVVSKVEVENFIDKVLALRQSVDRLASRIAKLKQQVKL